MAIQQQGVCRTLTFVLWGRVLTDGQELPATRVSVAGGRIVGVEPAQAPSQGDVAVDQGWIAPGLIDLQVNGAGGVDFTSADQPEAALRQVAYTLARHGVTAFCPTIVSSAPGRILECLAAYRPRGAPHGAESLGAHVEGPFIDPSHRGVHDPALLRDASADEIEQWLVVGAPSIVTLAPERACGLEAIRLLSRAGVVVSLGHSGADATQARAGLLAGARMATHLFNGMPPLHHRQPGLVGALLTSGATLGLITDGVHVDPVVVDMVIRCAGSARVALVSDALAAAGAPPGQSILGEQALVSDGRQVRRRDGTLAGSALLLDACLKNLRDWLPELAPATLLEMATRTPARLLGHEHKGRVAVGCDADLVTLDNEFNVTRAFVRGRAVL